MRPTSFRPATVTDSSHPPATLRRYGYAYDDAGNRTTEQIDDAPLAATFNARNQLVSRQPGGSLLFRGVVDEPATVTVQGKTAQVTALRLPSSSRARLGAATSMPASDWEAGIDFRLDAFSGVHSETLRAMGEVRMQLSGRVMGFLVFIYGTLCIYTYQRPDANIVTRLIDGMYRRLPPQAPISYRTWYLLVGVVLVVVGVIYTLIDVTGLPL